MNVKEAIEELKKWPQDAEVIALRLELIKGASTPPLRNHAAIAPDRPPQDNGFAGRGNL